MAAASAPKDTAPPTAPPPPPAVTTQPPVNNAQQPMYPHLYPTAAGPQYYWYPPHQRYYPQQPYQQQPQYQQPSAQPQQQQQQQQQTTVVVVANQDHCGQSQNVEPWSTGFCGCLEDPPSCLCALCCPQCFLCCLASDMNEFCFGPCLCGAHCFHPHRFIPCSTFITANHLFPNIFLVALRTKLRAKYGIVGSVFCDIMAVWCCEFCAATQIKRQLKYYQRTNS